MLTGVVSSYAHFLSILLMFALCGFARAETIDRPIQDDVFYFVLPDRFFNGDTANDTGGYPGDKRSHGFDPTDKGFFHGGDLKGLTAKLDYLKEMGITAIWMGPIFKNKPVGGDSAGYHGYWTTDFTMVDPHFGTNEDLKTLVKTAHQMGIKIFFDIIVNHTANVIQYRQDDESNGPTSKAPATPASTAPRPNTRTRTAAVSMVRRSMRASGATRSRPKKTSPN